MKRHIAIIAGGDSSEHEVSLRSAAGIYSFMDKERYDITIVVFDGKNWHTEDGCPIDKNDFSFTRGGVKHTFDFAYITIHGTPGENGILQGYLDMIGMPYSCCGVLAAALTFNKYACNHYLSYFGFHIANSMMLRAGQKLPNAPKIAENQSKDGRGSIPRYRACVPRGRRGDLRVVHAGYGSDLRCV